MAPLKANNWKDVCHPAIATNYEAPSGKRYYGHGFRTLSECHQVWTVITINLYHHCASSESLQKWMCGYIKYHWSSSSSFWQRQWRLQENDRIAGVWAGHCWHLHCLDNLHHRYSYFSSGLRGKTHEERRKSCIDRKSWIGSFPQLFSPCLTGFHPFFDLIWFPWLGINTE